MNGRGFGRNQLLVRMKENLGNYIALALTANEIWFKSQ